MPTPGLNRSRLTLVALLWLTLLASTAILAQDQPPPPPPPPPCVLAWIDSTTRLSDDAVQQAVRQLAQEQADPQHIVVLVHGFDTSREDSADQYAQLNQLIREEFKPSGQSVLVLGVQWDSDVGRAIQWLPAVAANKLLRVIGIGKKQANDPYLKKVLMARSVGRNGFRQLLLGVQQHFPRAHLELMAHSMGCEVAAAGMAPKLKYTDTTDKLDAYHSDQDIFLNVAALAGSDLDYDIWYKSNAKVRSQNERCKLMWMTMSPYFNGDRDSVLDMRENIRGKAAGAAFPRMNQMQYDTLLRGRRLVIDNQDIPSQHHFLKYYDQKRLDRIVGAIAFLTDPKASEPVELHELDQILDTPNRVEALLPWLDSPLISSRICAIWRLEMLDCGGSQHMADDTLRHIAEIDPTDTDALADARKNCPCVTVQKGYWPRQAVAAGQDPPVAAPQPQPAAEPTPAPAQASPGSGQNPFNQPVESKPFLPKQ